MPDTPTTETGRKVVAIYGDALLDDVLGIEGEKLETIAEVVDGTLARLGSALRTARHNGGPCGHSGLTCDELADRLRAILEPHDA